MRKNIIALRIPTFIIKDKGTAARLFSNLINANRRKNIEAAMIMSSTILKRNVSEFPKNNLKRNNSAAESKKNCI
jgi:hypothetical protein